jgi:hypothetical protein
VSDQTSSAIRLAWGRFRDLHDELLDLALAQGDLDAGAAAALLPHMIGHIQYMGLQLRSDPARPMLINAQFSPWNWGHSNPDTLYLSARVDDAHDYRVYGKLGTVAQTTFGVYAGKDDQAQAVKALADDLVVKPDGSFEIYFSRQKMGDSNWFELPAGADSFCCYQTFGDWDAQEKGTIGIECLNPGTPAGPASVEQSVSAFEAHLAASRDLFTVGQGHSCPGLRRTAEEFRHSADAAAVGDGRCVVRPHRLGTARRRGRRHRLRGAARRSLCGYLPDQRVERDDRHRDASNESQSGSVPGR